MHELCLKVNIYYIYKCEMPVSFISFPFDVVWARPGKIDSLNGLLESVEQDTTRAKVLIELGKETMNK